MLDMKELLAFSVEAKASDVHIAVGIPPKLRINGKLTEVEVPPLTPADAAEAIGSTMKERHVAILKDRGEVDFSFDSTGNRTFSCKCIHGQRKYGSGIQTRRNTDSKTGPSLVFQEK